MSFENQLGLKKDIPKIIHQIWWQGLSELPERYQSWFEQWSEMHPNWKHWCWDEAQVYQLMQEHYPKYLPLLKSYDKMIQRIDLSRIFILHHFGGVYCDMDSRPLKPLDSLLLDKGIKLFFDNIIAEKPVPVQLSVLVYSSGKFKHGPIINNDFMGSVAAHPFWELVMENLKFQNEHPKSKPEILYILSSTGPFFLTEVLRSSKWFNDPGTQLIPVELTNPGITARSWAKWVGKNQDQVAIDTSEAYMLHMGDNTWMPNKMKFIGKCLLILVLIVVFLLSAVYLIKKS